MALTSAQESVLEQIIEAFQNGKRLSDLPDVKGTNPYNLLVEVLDEDGESKKAALASLLPYAEEQVSYGIEFDTSVSSPSCLRIGNSDLHKVLPVQSRMKGCLLDDSGQVVEYLNPKDWTGNTRDGSRGQVMVEIPLHYRKFETDGTKRRVRLSELPLPGYHQVPKMYVSAYEASVQHSTKMLASVVNDSADFRSIYNDASYDGTYRSLLGRPATCINRTDFRAYARKRKPETAEWNCMTYEVQKTLYWLFVVEYATLNSQADYNAALTSEGLRQGGLGAGVTTWDEWDAIDYLPFVPCGHTDSLGNGTGTVEYTIHREDKSEWKTFSVPRYRGVENPFGHISQITDGINISFGRKDRLLKVFVCNDPSQFNDSNYTGYSHVGNEAGTSGWSKEIIFGEYGEIIPAVVGGGSTTYHCDYHNPPVSYAKLPYGVVFGGNATDGGKAGFAFAGSTSTESTRYNNVGSRLCFLPK